MIDRRRMLQFAAVAALGTTALTGCSAGISPSELLPSKPPPTPDVQQSAEMALIALYDAALLEVKGDRRRTTLERIRTEHLEHLRALGWEQLPADVRPAGSASRKGLIRAERAAMNSHTRSALETTDAEQAQVLALIAASEAQHIASLEDL